MPKYIHAVPNFSDGSRKDVVEIVVAQLRDKEGVKLIDYYPDANFNRTVIEVIGRPEPLKQALLNMAGKSYELINMEQQRGDHPRIGAQDTIPLFPLSNISLEECVQLAEEIGKEIFERFKVPVYFSGENARSPERRSLDYIRKGQYEGLKQVAHLPERAPDIGPAGLHPTAGATIVSASLSGLVAVNIILDTKNLKIAKSIAKAVRGPSGGFSTVRAIGLTLEERDQVAVSMNMFDTNNTPIFRVFNLVESEARRYGVKLLGTEIVGCLPNEALISCAEHYLRLENFSRKQIIENHMLGL
jgi:glutamate formiminotransferase/formiminotetrahydrofolate cyclodeaminase